MTNIHNTELYDAFDKLYESGYRFVEDDYDFSVVRYDGIHEIRTPIKYMGLTVDGVDLSDNDVDIMANFIGFLRSLKVRPK